MTKHNMILLTAIVSLTAQIFLTGWSMLLLTLAFATLTGNTNLFHHFVEAQHIMVLFFLMTWLFLAALMGKRWQMQTGPFRAFAPRLPSEISRPVLTNIGVFNHTLSWGLLGFTILFEMNRLAETPLVLWIWALTYPATVILMATHTVHDKKALFPETHKP